MRSWLEERALRVAYWLLWKCRGAHHSSMYNERVEEAQRAVAEIITVYYGPCGRAVGNR